MHFRPLVSLSVAADDLVKVTKADPKEKSKTLVRSQNSNSNYILQGKTNMCIIYLRGLQKGCEYELFS